MTALLVNGSRGETGRQDSRAAAHAPAKLSTLLVEHSRPLTIALSGGIDSITLMTIAHRVRQEPTVAVHAVSPAVPPQATRRCQRLARRFRWHLEMLDAGEFADKQYRANPANRCYFCKNSLFSSVLAGLHGRAGSLATGTNTDDLSDYRPGLQAAAEHSVWQPYTDAGIDKATIRRLAVLEGLGELAQLPAQPCLSSRIETGIAINAPDLKFVNHIERLLGRIIGAGDNRCRITRAGVVVQLPASSPVFLDTGTLDHLSVLLRRVCDRHDRALLRIEPYKMGSAFLHNGASDHHVVHAYGVGNLCAGCCDGQRRQWLWCGRRLAQDHYTVGRASA